MKRLFIGFALFISLILVTPSFSQIGVVPPMSTEPIIQSIVFEIDKETSIQNTITLATNHAVSIVGRDKKGWGTCSGVVIKNTKEESIVLTAKHCIGLEEELYVESILADSVGVSIFDDLAYIKLTEMIPNKTPVSISEFIPKKGDLVFIIGYPAMDLYTSIGKITIRTLDWQMAKIKVISGCSGAGAYNEYGELIGIVWGGIKTLGTGLFEKLTDVQKFVKKHKLLN